MLACLNYIINTQKLPFYKIKGIFFYKLDHLPVWHKLKPYTFIYTNNTVKLFPKYMCVYTHI